MIVRRIIPFILDDLSNHKMVLLSGPRQCGKTTLASELHTDSRYYSWDIEQHRKTIRGSALDESKDLWILDEIHKFKRWRNWLKGMYDLHKRTHKFIVTGSARLDLYARGGDSLQGRYFHYRLHPLTLSEILGTPTQDYRKSVVELGAAYDHRAVRPTMERLLLKGGFPEPFLTQSAPFAGRWRLAYSKRLVREDVRTLEQTQDLEQMEVLYERLPDLVGNNLSLNNIASDLEVAHQTASKWISIFEKLYGCFYVLPFGDARIKALKKERKLFLWDWSRNTDPGAQLENLVAVHLLRFVHWFEDVYGEVLELRYFKDADGHEVDFIITKKSRPWIAIEVKSSEKDPGKGLRYFLKKVGIPRAYQIHLKSETDAVVEKIAGTPVRILPVAKFLSNLP
jgi:predicted AAA+ superfamily ATPase